MAAQEDMTPWTVDGPHKSDAEQSSLPGRAFFSQLGIVRRKPARGDALPSMSKSCSDKIAAKQCLSLLSSTTALFVNPERAYIDTLVLPEDRYSAVGCSRAFGPEGRLEPMADAVWEDGHSFKPFRIDTTNLDFDFSKTSVEKRGAKISASNLAAVWTSSGIEETILGGVVQGRKAFDIRGASSMSRTRMWAKAKELGESLGGEFCLDVLTYRDIKALPALATRKTVKRDIRTKALTGWVCNEGDDDFQLE